MFKRKLVKPDGRELTLYSRRTIPEGIQATNPDHAKLQPRSHFRWHPLRQEWVAYASHRQERTFLPPKAYNPLAPTRSKEFPTELPEGDYDIAVFDNLFSSFGMNLTEAPELLVPTRPAQGHCEVVVFAQDAETSLAYLPLDHIDFVLQVWTDRYRAIAEKPGIQYILPFENRGVEVGVTIHHPHGQIYSYPFIPPVQQQMLRSQQEYWQEKGRTLIGDMIVEEKRSGARLVHRGETSMAFVPVCARYPYEVWIAPQRPVASLVDFTPAERLDFARTLKTVLLKYEGLWQRPFPYLMALFSAPSDGEPHPEWHFHLQFSPPYRSRDRLKYLAGTELAAGVFVNDSLPEEKAKELRDVEVHWD